ncbi:MAG: YbaN family protein [Phycisphaeraceae bacterium JB051]
MMPYNVPMSDSTAKASPLRRYLLAGLGVLLVGVGAVGVVVPGLPTTVFLIMACWCFARSCPWLEQRLIRNRFFAPFLIYVDHPEKMPRKARVISTVVMWTAITISATILFFNQRPDWLIATVLACGPIGTWYIWRVGKK